MLSFSAFAADFSDDTDFGISVYDVAVTGANYKDVLAGTENAGTVSFDPDGNVLTLKGLNLSKSASRYYNLLTVNRDSITVRLEGENISHNRFHRRQLCHTDDKDLGESYLLTERAVCLSKRESPKRTSTALNVRALCPKKGRQCYR